VQLFLVIQCDVAEGDTGDWVIPDVTQCYRPPPREHAEVSVYQDPNGIVAIYTCLTGYYFAAGGTTRTMFCVDNAWSLDMPDCERES